MHIAAVAAAADVRIVAIEVAGNAADIADDVPFFIFIIIVLADDFRYKSIVIPRARGHDVAAVIDPIDNRADPIGNLAGYAEIAGNAAHVMGAVDIVFLIGSIGNIRVFRPAYDTAHIPGVVVVIPISFMAAHITRVEDVGDAARVAAGAGDAAHIRCIDLRRMDANSLVITMIGIGVLPMACRRHSAAVFRVPDRRNGHRADDAAHVILPGHVHAVLQGPAFTAEGRIHSLSDDAAHVIASARDRAVVIGRAVQYGPGHAADDAAHILTRPVSPA